jgi:hypothetical protein
MKVTEIIELCGGVSGVAKTLLISRPTVHNWKRCNKMPVDQLLRLADAYDGIINRDVFKRVFEQMTGGVNNDTL